MRHYTSEENSKVSMYSILLGIWIVINIGIRSIGLKCGLPYSLIPDEISLISRAIGVLKGKIILDYYSWPASFLIYVYAIEILLTLTIAYIFFGKDIFYLKYLLYYNRTPIYIICRFTSLIFFGGTLILIYKFCKKMINNDLYAFWSAVLFSFYPLTFFDARVINPNMGVVFFGLWSIYLSYLGYKKNDLKYIYYSSALSSIGCTVKYTNIVTFPFILLTLILIKKKNWLKELTYNLLLFSIIYTIFAFHTVIHPFTTLSTIFDPAYRIGNEKLPILKNFLWYITKVVADFNDTYGIFLGEALIGIAILLFRKELHIIIQVLYVITYFIIMGRTLRLEYWMFPIIPFLFIWASLTWNLKLKNAKVFFLITLIPIYSYILKDIQLQKKFTSKPVAIMSIEYVKKNIPPGSFICYEFNAGPLHQDRYIKNNYILINAGVRPVIEKIEKLKISPQYLLISKKFLYLYRKQPKTYKKQLKKWKEIKRKYRIIDTLIDKTGDFVIILKKR